MWRPASEPWQYRVLDALPPGIDAAQLEQQRHMTPTERIRAAESLVRTAEEIQAARAKAASRR